MDELHDANASAIIFDRPARYSGGMSRRKDKAIRKQKEKHAKAKVRSWRNSQTSTSQSNDTANSIIAPQLENRRFNRLESNRDHLYITGYGFKSDQLLEYDGWIKCRLLHGRGYSLIVPDQIYLEHRGLLLWIQPLAFNANLLAKLDDNLIDCHLDIDISCGHHLTLNFFSHDHVTNMHDGSQLFRCKIRGPKELDTYATGDAEWGSGNVPYIRVFHHTEAKTVPLILESKQFRTSDCNIQGTSKKLVKVAYSYFTSLDTIKTNSDLKQITMSAGGTIELRRDGFTPPPNLSRHNLAQFKDDILRLDVYQCDPLKREASVGVWIDASILAPQHVYRHDEGISVYYELPHHFIHRVGAAPGNTISFNDELRIHRQSGLKNFDYVVVGDCTELSGLAAPYDEEDTTHILKIERIPTGQTMLEFWFANKNTNLFSQKTPEMQIFRQVEDEP